MRYSEEVVAQVKDRSEIVSVISAYVKLQRRGSNWFGLCPFHNEKSPSFSVSASKQIYYCFGCGSGGNVFRFIMQYDNCGFPEAVQTLAQRAGIELPEQEMSEEERQRQDLRSRILEANRLAAGYYYYQLRSPAGASGMAYFRERALTDETMKSFGLGYAGMSSNNLYRYLRSKGLNDQVLSQSGLITIDERRGASDKFWNRVMFPIMDVNRRVIGFGGRVMGDGKPKYLNSPETLIFDKSRTLYGFYAARRSKENFLILCEGYMDVIAMHQAGFTNAVATLGTSLTQQHCIILRRYVQDVILSYDSDEAGIRAALRAIPMLRNAGVTARILHLDPCKDPDEFIKKNGAEAFRQRLEQAENSFLFEISILERGYRLKDPDSKTAFLRQAASRIAGFELEVQRESYIETLAEKYHVSQDGLRRMVLQYLKNGLAERENEAPSAADLLRNGMEPQLSSRVPGRTVKEEGVLASERLLLCWMADHPEACRQIRQYLEAEDFSPGIYREIASVLYEQLETGSVDIGAIMNRFSGEEEQRECARIFSSQLSGVEAKQEEKAVRELIRTIVDTSLRRKDELAQANLEEIQKILARRRKLDEIGRLVIPADQ